MQSTRPVAAVAELGSFGAIAHRMMYIGDALMRKKEHPLDEPLQQWSWKITLTIVCAIVGAILTLYLTEHSCWTDVGRREG